MPRLPTVKPRQLIRALERAGFEIDHQTGSPTGKEFVEIL
jgi:predicted RNA binding protein YcfA (HicA-like mRNA interferase family)